MVDPAWVALSLSRHIGGKKLRALLEHFDHDPQKILNADMDSLCEVRGIGAIIAQDIQQINFETITRAIPQWEKQDIQIVTRNNNDAFPSRLLEIDDEPPTLFVRGNWAKCSGDRAIAIVGTRRPSSDSLQKARSWAAGQSAQGHTIVSGLAKGIDTAAHMGALDAKGCTVAVLGCGVLNIYPPENELLAERIMEQGAIISEVHPHASPNAARLVSRNRIISGLCGAVIVVETGVDGGAMYAAKRAREQGRKVYALDIAASGNQALIKDGAIAIPPDWHGDEILL